MSDQPMEVHHSYCLDRQEAVEARLRGEKPTCICGTDRGSEPMTHPVEKPWHDGMTLVEHPDGTRCWHRIDAARSATPSSEEELREALAEDAALLHHYVHPDVSFEECDGARCVRRRAALAPPSSEEDEDERKASECLALAGRVIAALHGSGFAIVDQEAALRAGGSLDDGPWQQMSDAASPGPWKVVPDPSFKAGRVVSERGTVADVRYRNGHNDGPFIVAAVNYVRAALASTERAATPDNASRGPIDELRAASRAVLDWTEKERWAGPHDWLDSVLRSSGPSDPERSGSGSTSGADDASGSRSAASGVGDIRLSESTGSEEGAMSDPTPATEERSEP